MTRARIGRSTAMIGLVCLAFGGCTSRPVVASDPTTKNSVNDEVSALAIDKIDLLFSIDNSASMGDKQALLKQAVPDLVGRLLRPNCVDRKDENIVYGPSENGQCAKGKLEFHPVTDLHVAVVSSSLGDRGSQQSCPDGKVNPTYPTLAWHYNDGGHLLNRAGADGHALPDAQPASFLAWFPTTDENKAKPAPPVTAIGDITRFTHDFEDLVSGVGQYGCFYEAQQESWYRFLIQPDPEKSVVLNGGIASLEGVDEEVIKARHDFLRPDSLVAVIQITDEDESTVDPRAVYGQGWRYASPLGPTKPTAACAANPDSKECTACALLNPMPPECGSGYFSDDPRSPENPMNVRFFHMKQRFGVDPQYPVERYVKGLQSATVPDRTGEYPTPRGPYVGNGNCTNPLYAGTLPASATEDLCHRPANERRRPGMVFFAAITGVPNDLLHFDPKSPEKSKLTDADWLKILGKDPLHYDFTGVDPRMRQSIEKRKERPTTGVDRDWDTAGNDLQYACTFELPASPPKTCDGSDPACDCELGSDSPLCDPTQPRKQLRAKAYPGVRHLALAKALGEQGIVSSICPIDTKDSSQDNMLFGYRPAMKVILDRLKDTLTSQCLPRALKRASGNVAPCVVLEALPTAGDESACNDAARGLSIPEDEVLRPFRHAHEDLAAFPVCKVDQIPVEPGATCTEDAKAGWCYVDGDAAVAATRTCTEALLFSAAGSPPSAAKVFLQCIETSTSKE